jgi:hypothetical protein
VCTTTRTPGRFLLLFQLPLPLGTGLAADLELMQAQRVVCYNL